MYQKCYHVNYLTNKTIKLTILAKNKLDYISSIGHYVTTNSKLNFSRLSGNCCIEYCKMMHDDEYCKMIDKFQIHVRVIDKLHHGD